MNLIKWFKNLHFHKYIFKEVHLDDVRVECSTCKKIKVIKG